MLGVAVIPIDTDPLRVWLQWNRGMNIFDAPKMRDTYFGNTMPKANLGDIDWYGVGAMGTLKRVGVGILRTYILQSQQYHCLASGQIRHELQDLELRTDHSERAR